ncbi:NUDIX hydrolase [Paracoccus sp. (in: a-proteobacteria)]|uniref:NUDIX hydrolase n=1 Tax=Paracoccus sp. TaxID=267 RepID=UPI003A8B3536
MGKDRAFHGAKLILIRDGRLLTCLRDDLPHIPFPAHWDLPGGGREGQETPVGCALRELHEEFGLSLPPDRLHGREFPAHAVPGMTSWLFLGTISQTEIAAIRFGDEGQEWQMMPIAEYLAHPRAVPHFPDRIRRMLAYIA